MGVVSWIVIGLLAGWLAGRITNSPRGQRLGITVAPNFWGELVTAIVGAVILLGLWQAIRRA